MVIPPGADGLAAREAGRLRRRQRAGTEAHERLAQGVGPHGHAGEIIVGGFAVWTLLSVFYLARRTLALYAGTRFCIDHQCAGGAGGGGKLSPGGQSKRHKPQRHKL